MSDAVSETPARVLIVDDTPANIDVLRSILELEGYRTSFAISGEQALKLVARAPIDLILLDVMMPGMNGFETCRRLKADEEVRDIPVIFVTARSETEDVVQGFEAGAVDYVPKPFRREEVLARVRTQLELQALLGEKERLIEKEREQARRIQEIFDNVDDGIFTLDGTGTILFVNPAAETLLGCLARDVVGGHLLDFLSAADGGATPSKPPDRPMLACGRQEVMARRVDGSAVSMDLSLTRLDGDQPLFVGVLHDISPHKATESELRQASRTDELTRLPNRRRFREALELEWLRARRLRQPISLLLIDIDFFKQYNDAYGHQAGDDCLAAVARALSSTCQRATDLAARYGGEEFVVLLPETDEEGAVAQADKVRLCVEGLAMDHRDSDAAAVVTVSVGTSTMVPDATNSPSMLVAIADRALYQAKALGRNRVAS